MQFGHVAGWTASSKWPITMIITSPTVISHSPLSENGYNTCKFLGQYHHTAMLRLPRFTPPKKVQDFTLNFILAEQQFSFEVYSKLYRENVTGSSKMFILTLVLPSHHLKQRGEIWRPKMRCANKGKWKTEVSFVFFHDHSLSIFRLVNYVIKFSFHISLIINETQLKCSLVTLLSECSPVRHNIKFHRQMKCGVNLQQYNFHA